MIDELKVNEEKAKKDLADAEAKKVATQAQIDLEKKGIQDKMDATALLITNETKTMIEEDAKRRKLEAEYTDFFTGEIAKRTEAMTALKQAVADAKLAIESAGINQATLTGAAGNSTAVSVVNNIANNVDMESAMRYVNSKIPTK